MGAILLIAQATAATGGSPATPPDIEISTRIEAREIRIEQEGPIRLDLYANPGLTDTSIERSQPAGAQSYRNLVIAARVAAWLRQEADGSITVSTEDSTGETPQ